jgi:outer membrane receptor protein involved in Fe transport
MSSIKNRSLINNKFLLFIVGFLFANISIYAQTAIQGRVVNEGKSIEFANVLLYKNSDSSKFLKATATDSLGHFQFSSILDQNYFIKISMVGFVSKRIDLSPSKTSDINLKDLELAPDNTTTTFEVVSQRKLIKKTATGFVVNAKDNLVQASGTATDLLRNTPTVVVDEEGNITLRGKSPLILVNGRNSALSSTQRIPASSVETIEIINNPSAKYDANAEGGIINIVLKKNTNKGTNGSVAIGAGTSTKGRESVAFLLSHQTSNWNIGLGYDNRISGRDRDIDAERVNYLISDIHTLAQKRNDDRLELTHNAKFNMDYTPNKKNSFGFEMIGNLNGEDNREKLFSTLLKSDNSLNSRNSRISNEIVREKGIESDFNFSHLYDDKRKSLNFNISSSINYDKQNTGIITQSLTLLDQKLGAEFLQKTHDYQNSSIHNLKLDYAFPVSSNGLIETGLKSTFRKTDADFESADLINANYLVNTAASNNFHFKEQIHAGYLLFKNSTGPVGEGNLKYEIGLRAEQTNNQGEAVVNRLQFTNQYLKLFPSANLMYSTSTNSFIKVVYSRRINRPGLGQLNPFVDITDSLNPHSGNPYLKPELVNAFEVGYNFERNDFSLLTNVFYRHATDMMRSITTLNNNGVALSAPQNLGTGNSYGIEELISLKPTKYWTINGSASLYEQKIDGSNISADAINSYTSWYTKMINNFSLSKNTKLQVIANYNSPIATPQGTRIEVYNVDMGFQHKLWKGKGAIGAVITDVFDTQRGGVTAMTAAFKSYRYFKVDTRAIFLTFTYSFRSMFKEELLKNKFSND